MSLLPSLPDFKDITARVEHGQGEIASRLDAIIALLNRLTEVMSARALLDGIDPAVLSTPAWAAVPRASARARGTWREATDRS